jgi:hypothetical protein
MAFIIPIIEALAEIVEAGEAAAAAVGETAIDNVTAFGNAFPSPAVEGEYAVADVNNFSQATKIGAGLEVTEAGLGAVAGSTAIYATAANNPHGNVQATGSGEIPTAVSTVDDGKTVVYDPANPTPPNPNVYNPTKLTGSGSKSGLPLPANYCPGCELNRDIFSIPWGNVPMLDRYLRRRKKKKKNKIYLM